MNLLWKTTEWYVGSSVSLDWKDGGKVLLWENTRVKHFQSGSISRKYRFKNHKLALFRDNLSKEPHLEDDKKDLTEWEKFYSGENDKPARMNKFIFLSYSQCIVFMISLCFLYWNRITAGIHYLEAQIPLSHHYHLEMLKPCFWLSDEAFVSN